jgi:hypothetical protein
MGLGKAPFHKIETPVIVAVTEEGEGLPRDLNPTEFESKKRSVLSGARPYRLHD